MWDTVRRPPRARQYAEQDRDGEDDAAPEMSRDNCTGIAAAIGEEEAEGEREEAAQEGEDEDEFCCFAQGGATRAGDFKQGQEDEQADGKMYGEGMEAAEELLPVGVRVAVEADDGR